MNNFEGDKKLLQAFVHELLNITGLDKMLIANYLLMLLVHSFCCCMVSHLSTIERSIRIKFYY